MSQKEEGSVVRRVKRRVDQLESQRLEGEAMKYLKQLEKEEKAEKARRTRLGNPMAWLTSRLHLSKPRELPTVFLRIKEKIPCSQIRIFSHPWRAS